MTPRLRVVQEVLPWPRLRACVHADSDVNVGSRGGAREDGYPGGATERTGASDSLRRV